MKRVIQAFYHWGDPRREDDDSCETGLDSPEDFERVDQLQLVADPFEEYAKFYKSVTGREWRPLYDIQWVHLIFDDGTEEFRRNPRYRPQVDDDSAERCERAMQAGMAFGCAGYNDEMGWGLDHD